MRFARKYNRSSLQQIQRSTYFCSLLIAHRLVRFPRLKNVLLSRTLRPRVLLIQTYNGYFYPDRIRIPIGKSFIPRYAKAINAPINDSETHQQKACLKDAQARYSLSYVKKFGHFKAYSASVRALQQLANSFNYKTVYVGWLSVIFVDNEIPSNATRRGSASFFSDVDDLRALCRRYIFSNRGRERAWPKSRGFCDETKLVGLSSAELRDLYHGRSEDWNTAIFADQDTIL